MILKDAEPFDASAVGKRIFKTSEEAEAALAKRKEN